MALCRELCSVASFSGRIDGASNLQSRRRIDSSRNDGKLRAARLFSGKDFVACVASSTGGATSCRRGRRREWQIMRATRHDADASANSLRGFYATCEPGLEPILAAELSSPLVGASQVELGRGGVSFVGSATTGYNANLWLRTADRVLCELARGALCKGSRDGVYDFVREAADWRLLLVDEDARQAQTTPSPTKRLRFRKFELRVRIQNSSHREDEASVSTTARDAIWDSLRESSGPQWPEPAAREDPVSVPLSLHVHRGTAVLYRDMSGVSLLHRNMEESTSVGRDLAKAKEGVAAAVLTMAGWNHMVPGFGEANKNDAQGKGRVLLDPFCGTGAFLVQAALMASNVAPGLMRRQWPFQTWHDYEEGAFTRCRDAAASMQAPSLAGGARLIGNDMNDGAIARCKRLARAAGVLHLLELSCGTSRHYQPPATPTLVVTSPPCSAPFTYASLRGEDERLFTMWQGFGQFLKSQCRGADVYVLCKNDWLTHAMHMVPDRKWEMQPDKQWRGRFPSGRRNDKLFGSHERKLLHFHVAAGRVKGDPVSVIPFSSLSPNPSVSL